MFKKYGDTIINLAEIQSVRPSGYDIEFTFVNGKTILIKTNQYDYIINGPGRTTKAMYQEYDECMEKWQKLTIEGIYTSLKLRG